MEQKTKICNKCRETVDYKAKKCPHCHSSLGTWFWRHPILTALIILFCLPIFIALISPTDNSKPSNTQVTSATTTTSTPKASGSVKMGETGYIRLPNITDKDQVILLGATKEDAGKITKALMANDMLGILEIPGAFGVGNGTKVLVIDSSITLRKVRIIEGVNEVDKDKVGMSGWLPFEWVVSN